MNTFIDFISFKDPNVLYVVLGMLFINSSSALIGTFAFLRKRALVGDAVAHALLPGLCLGFIFAGEKNITYLLLGAVATGWIATYAIDAIVNRSKVKQDAAIGIVLSSFFAVGVVLLTYIQNSASGQQSGLDHFLFGQAAAINKSEIGLFAVIFALILLAVVLFFKSFVVVAFNADFAKSIGLPVRFIEFLITSLTVLAIASGIQALGVILMSALIVTPGAAARLWTHKLKLILLVAILISVFSGIGGAYVSYSSSGMPTGPWVVMFLSVFMFGSILFAPKTGIISRFKRARNNRRKILHENILKAIYHIHEKQGKQQQLADKLTVSDILTRRKFETDALMKGIARLMRADFILKDGNAYYLTESGKKESRRIVRLHRLWEQYLLKRTSIDQDHVHSGAEAIEHIISPELEKELEKELGITGIPKEDY
ncbi:MAG: iron chelate uptake ABC transporter family permease subunit [Crocinitomicaceae bacterium]